MASLGVLEVLIRTKDETEKGIKAAEKNTKMLGDKLTSWTIAKGQMIAKFAEKAITSTANVMKSTVKSAFNAFAEYEQLEGGIQTLFDNQMHRASDRVMNYAKEAYKTAGISANQYMETVTAFSASLIQSLGGDTVAAADVADMAIIDMADNVNKMGSSMESVENAYKGFAKSNYTMLDNLKLGYGGTRSEMERLLKDASKLTGQKYDIKNLADVYKAIHAIQEEMGIAGATEKEAMTTVEGSFKAAKAAWQDVLTSIGRGKDIKRTVKNFSQTLSVAFKNARPVLRNAISGVFTAIREILPDLGGLVDDLISDMKNSDSPVLQLVASALEKVKKLGEEVYELITDFPGKIQEWKESDSAGLQALAAVFETLSQAATVLKAAFDGGLEGAIDKLKEIGTPVSETAAAGLEAFKKVCEFFVGRSDLGGIIQTIALGFVTMKGVTIAASVITFLSKLSALGNAKNLKQLTNMFQNGFNFPKETPTPTGGNAAGDVAKGGIFSKVGTWISSRASLLGAGATTSVLGLMGALTAGGILGANMINANRNDANLNAIYGTEGGTNDSIIDTMSDDAVKAAKAYWEAYQNTGSEEAMNARDKLFDILSGAGYENTEQGVSFIENIFDNLINGNDADGLGERLTKRFVEIGAQLPLEPDYTPVEQSEPPVLQGIVEYNPAFGDSDYTMTPLGKQFRRRKKVDGSDAKGDWNVPYDNYNALLHRGEMVLTASQARKFREGGMGDTSAIVSAIQGLRNDMANLKLVVGRKTFGRAVVNYGGDSMNDYIGGSESRAAAGYGT